MAFLDFTTCFLKRVLKFFCGSLGKRNWSCHFEGKKGEEKRKQKGGRKVRGGGTETQCLQIPNLRLFKALLLLRKHSTLDDFP